MILWIVLFRGHIGQATSLHRVMSKWWLIWSVKLNKFNFSTIVVDLFEYASAWAFPSSSSISSASNNLAVIINRRYDKRRTSLFTILGCWRPRGALWDSILCRCRLTIVAAKYMKVVLTYRRLIASQKSPCSGFQANHQLPAELNLAHRAVTRLLSTKSPDLRDQNTGLGA